MGVQLSNVLTGNTGGTIITVDYTGDFSTLNQNLVNLYTALGEIRAELVFIDANITALNTNLNAAIGATGVATVGSVAYSSDAAVGWLAGISEQLGKMWDQQGKAVSTLGQIHLATSSAASAANESVAVAQIVAADQMSTNEFNKTATKEALARNGISAPAPRPITEIIQEKISEATTINATAAATAFVDDKLTKGVTKAATFGADLFAQSKVGGYLAEKWTAFTDIFSDATAAVDKAEIEAAETLSKGLAAKRAKI
jgi:hypothetical protein